MSGSWESGGGVDLDYNAGAAPDPRVVEAMRALGPDADGNPHAPHAKGRAARKVLEDARDRIATALGFAADELVLCSGGTEANNIALACARAARERTGSKIGVSSIEHPSIEVPARALAEADSSAIAWLPWEAGALALGAEPLAFVSCILAQGEFGFVQDLGDVRARIPRAGDARCVLHTDASQALGRLALREACAPADLVTISPHKAGGPRGVGVLAVREGVGFRPALRGGAQELGRRPGTQAPRLVHGAALAVELAEREWSARAKAMRRAIDAFLAVLRPERAAGELLVVGEDLVPAPRLLANTRMLVLPGVESRVLVPALDVVGVATSYGSACSSGAAAASPALRALGIEEPWLQSSLRVSVGADPNCEKVEHAAALFSQVLARIRGARHPSTR